MARHNNTGKLGEEIAGKFLEKKRFKILGRNIREPWGELDLLARDPGGALVFCEVKTTTGFGSNPEQHYTIDKNRKTLRFTELFIAKHPELISKKFGYRIDLLAVELPEGNITEKSPVIRHYEGVSSVD